MDGGPRYRLSILSDILIERGCKYARFGDLVGWKRTNIADAPGHMATFSLAMEDGRDTIAFDNVWTVARHLYFTEDETHQIMDEMRRRGGLDLEP